MLLRVVLCALALLVGCGREDNAREVSFAVSGSAQNPSFSPDDERLLFTLFRGGYNEGPADLLVGTLASSSARVLVSDGSDNVSLPGSSWSDAIGSIVFTSSRAPHDEVFVIDDEGTTGDEKRVTARDGLLAFEPSFAPDGARVVFESHVEPADDAVDDAEDLAAGPGTIMTVDVAGLAAPTALTDGLIDCRQPNWSPAGGLIVFQQHDDRGTHLYLMAEDGNEKRPLTTADGEETDASFSPDGAYVVFSGSADDGASIFVISVDGGDAVRLTTSAAYDGAPTFSRDGKRIAFESAETDPDGTAGTRLFVVDAPPSR